MHDIIKKFPEFILIAALVVLTPVHAQTLNRGYGYDIDVGVIDPHNESYDDMFDLAAHYLGTLLTVGEDNSFQPGLAESWQQDRDKKTLTLHLKQGLTWTDGEPITADTVKRSFERAMSKKMVSTEKHLLDFLLDDDRESSEIVNSAGKQGSWDSKLSLPNVEVINAQELVLQNFPSNNAGLNALTHVFSAPLPLHQLDNEGQFPKDILMVSSGPYQLKKSENSKEVRFARNEKFAGEKIYFSDVNFYFGEYKDLIGEYLSFGLDILEGVDTKQVQWLNSYYPKDLYAESDGSEFLVLRNVNDGKYSKSIRKAMMSMINRDVIYELLNASEHDELTGLISWENINYPRKPNSRHHFLSIGEAKSVMKSAGFSKENRLKVCIGISEFRSTPRVDNYLKTQWGAIYIDVEFKRMTDEQFESGVLNIEKGPPCIGVIHSYASRFHSEEEILDMFFENGFFKGFRFTNPQILALRQQIKRTADPEQRGNLVASLERKMLDTYKVFRLNNYEEHSLVKPYLANYSRAKGNGVIALSQYLNIQE